MKTYEIKYPFLELKNVKKAIDDKDRARKASVLAEVADAAKAMLQANPNLPYLVHEFNNAYAQNKALDGALKQVSNDILIFLSATMFYHIRWYFYITLKLIFAS